MVSPIELKKKTATQVLSSSVSLRQRNHFVRRLIYIFVLIQSGIVYCQVAFKDVPGIVCLVESTQALV